MAIGPNTQRGDARLRQAEPQSMKHQKLGLEQNQEISPELRDVDISITPPASTVTPLPNKLEDEAWQVAGNLVVGRCGISIAQVLEPHHAKLISAAPELLKALQELTDDAQYALNKFLPPGSYSLSNAIAHSKEAITKATQ